MALALGLVLTIVVVLMIVPFAAALMIGGCE